MTIETFLRDACLMVGIAAFAVLFAEMSGVAQWLKMVVGKSVVDPDKPTVKYKIKYHGYVDMPQYKRVPAKRIKPLDCPMCLAFWLGIVTYKAFRPEWEFWFPAILYAAACSILAIFISRNLRY